MTPAMIASWFIGIWLASFQELWSQMPIWFTAKIVCLFLLTACHMWLARQVRVFANDANSLSSRSYRIVNEVPTVLMIAIIILVVVKPGG